MGNLVKNKKENKMGYKGLIRSIIATSKKNEKSNNRERKEAEKRQLEYYKRKAFENAKEEVENFGNYINMLKSLHLKCEESIEWESILNSKEPSEPIYDKSKEEIAERNFAKYNPSFVDKIFKTDSKKLKELEEKIKIAKEEGKKYYEEKVKEYNEQVAEIQEIKKIAEKVLQKDKSIYDKVINEMLPFSDIENIGSVINFKVLSQDLMEVELKGFEEEVIPKNEKTLLKTGKVSSKPYSMGRYYEIYQDYICSATIRIAREIFAVLPIEKVIINCFAEELNTATGNKEEICILSIMITKKELEKLNVEKIDPSESLKNFVHNMNFKKTSGMKCVDKLDSKIYY